MLALASPPRFPLARLLGQRLRSPSSGSSLSYLIPGFKILPVSCHSLLCDCLESKAKHRGVHNACAMAALEKKLPNINTPGNCPHFPSPFVLSNYNPWSTFCAHRKQSPTTESALAENKLQVKKSNLQMNHLFTHQSRTLLMCTATRFHTDSKQ